jgi:hypothetical protein
MKETNDLETQLRSWAPRRPSLRLSARLFPNTPIEDPLPNLRLSWLAPATAGFLLLFSVFSQHSNHEFGGSSTVSLPFVASIMSNQSAAAYLPGSFSREQNNLPADTFRWTNGRTFTSSISPLSRSRDKF